MIDLTGQKVSVIGAGRSGISASSALKLFGAHVLLADARSESELSAETLAAIESAGVALAAGASPAESVPNGTDLVVTSPGVPKSAPVLLDAVSRDIPIWSEIELAYRIAPCRIIAVTGTNGKTTTTLLIEAMLRAGGIDAVAAGNVSADEIKRTLVDAALDAHRDGRSDRILVAEISSFQLEWVEKFAPWIAVITNVTPDHMNRHTCFDEYAATKARLLSAQTEKDWAILNGDDATVRAMAAHGVASRAVWISLDARKNRSGSRGWLTGGRLRLSIRAGDALELIQANELPSTLPGEHSIYNVLAAAAASTIAGVPVGKLSDSIRSFPGVAHRMEPVACIGGVRYINNSMCSNVAAAAASLRAIGRPAIVIAGGADKNMDFSPLAAPMLQHARQAILIGAAADKIEKALRAGGYTRISRASTLECAVQAASKSARSGEAVVLSPGCASFDMFRDFEARGEAFRRAVRAIENKEANS